MPANLAEIAESLQRIERLSSKTSETVGILNERQGVMREEMTELKEHQKWANGNMTEILAEQHEMRGAILVLRWLVGAVTAGVGAGAALAGVILALVSRG